MNFSNMSSDALLTMFYVWGNVIGIIVVSLLLIKNWKNKQTQSKCFNTMLIFLIIYFIGDGIWAFAYFKIIPNHEIIIKLARMIYYSAANFIAYAWFMYVEIKIDFPIVRSKKRKYLFIPIIISFIAGIIICSFLNPAEKNIYGYLTAISLVLVPFTYIFVSGVHIIKKAIRTKEEYYDRHLKLFAIWPFGILIVSILQILFAEFPIYCYGAVIVSMYLYILNQDSYIFTDALTKINNRAAFNKYLKEIDFNDSSYYLMILDIDKFKSINDTYGHIEGDRALIYFANLLKKSIGNTCFLARYGGDEFVIIVKTNNEDDVKEIINNINSLTKNTENDLGYKCTTSSGYIKLDKDIDIEKSINEADKMLYQNKEIAHNK